ncbi:YjcZ family sporulation protein [Paenibacillus sp. TAF58]
MGYEAGVGYRNSAAVLVLFILLVIITSAFFI